MRLSSLLVLLLACSCASPTSRTTAFEFAELPPLVVAPLPAESEQPTVTEAWEADVLDLAPVTSEMIVSVPKDHAPYSPQSRRGFSSRRGLFNLTLGSRYFEDSRWGPLDNQFALGVDYTLKPSKSPIGFNFGISGAGTQEKILGSYVEAWQTELTVGPRFYLMLPQLPFFLYGGVAGSLVYGEIDVLFGGRRSDTQFGGVATAGFMFELGRAQALGFEWRTLQGTDFGGGIPGLPNDMNYQQFSMVFCAAF